mmetsp:Transcript_20756/g.51487  ORF Transcript_20756/g.51487 Transcript_20756/m.51487 type:complete len:500 (+) Transcript_20756:136-1635(+)
MRQRKANLTFLNHGDEESQSSQSDHEDTILAAHPEDGDDIIVSTRRRVNSFLRDLAANQTKWAQCVTIAVAALATYSFHNVGASVNVQVSIMTIITLVGASPLCKTHLTTASIGAFVGGQNIIGATNSLQGPIVADAIYTSYLWLLALSLGVGLVWTQFVTHPRIQLLDGYSGRLGSTTFIGMNLVMVTVWGPLGVVGWNRYYYGLVDIVHVAEEDSAPDLASAWKWTEEAELAIGYVLAVIFLGVLSGFTRIKHNQYIQEWHGVGEETAPTPLNNVLIPVLFSLTSILIVNATNYRHAVGLYNGFAVGAYVGMASLQKIPSVVKFATISLTAALWGLTLTPFFVGFAGKSGFTSMMGHITHDAVETFVWKRIQYRLQRKQRLEQQQREEEQQRLRQEEERLSKLKKEQEEQQLLQDRQKEPYHPPHKPSRKKELVLSTKQQRRQQQRLKQLQKHQNPQPKQPLQEEAAPLRHRAWVAPSEGDHWDHPQLHEATKIDVV